MTDTAPASAGFAGGVWHDLVAWECCVAECGLEAPPADAAWEPFTAPNGIAGTRAAQSMARDQLESHDWWFRTTLPAQAGAAAALCFEGVATICDVRLDGHVLARHHNAFVPFTVPLPPETGLPRELLVCCRALQGAGVPGRPRARWRTRLVEDNAIRWHRTPLAGRIPGWWSGAPIVGPWRPVRHVHGMRLERLHVVPQLDGDGVPSVTFSARLEGVSAPVRAALHVGAHAVPLEIVEGPDGLVLRGAGRCPGLAPWWPHTHGDPVCHAALVEVAFGDAPPARFELAPLGFRRVAWDAATGTLSVNGVPIFARGACWTAFDPTHARDRDDIRDATIAQVVAAGFNLVRVTGCFPYVGDSVLAACDAHGVLVWHDLALASMDYPFADAEFAGRLSHEITTVARRWAAHPSVAIIGGGSELGQQAAMMGLAPDTWRAPFLLERVPALLAEANPGVGWVPYVPGGGDDLPFRANAPVTHYFGVGAYRQGLDDIRRSGVRFAAECLAFAHLPEERTLLEAVATPAAWWHDPRWRAGMPRDNAVSWDFGDVRDHYLEQRYGVHAQRLRTDDVERYLALSRSVSGEVVAAALAEMRRPGGASGAVLWWLRDLVPGDGWGLVDAAGRVKPAWWHVRRALQPRTVLITDEGLNGLAVHVVNDGDALLEATLEVRRVRADRVVESGAMSVSVPARGASSWSAEAVLGGFRDITWTYRFGPAGHDAVQVRLVGATGAPLAVAWHWISTPPAKMSRERPALAAQVQAAADGWLVTIEASVLERGVVVDVPGGVADDAWFDLAPGEQRVVRVRRGSGSGEAGTATVRSLDARGALVVALP